jgi:S1/P1 Nuclease
MKKLCCVLMLVAVLVLPQPVLAWNGTGHRLVASIAWDNLSDTTRKKIVNLMRQAPKGNCLRELFNANDGEREFFVAAATWPDILRGGKGIPKQCTDLHKPEWHFKDRFWSGVSGDSQNPPKDLNRPLAKINAVERLEKFRSFVNGNGKVGDRAMGVAWMIHLVGDIHQPLHTSGRVTATEQNGDVGGNTFFVGPAKIVDGKNLTPKLHGYWDNIVDSADPRLPDEKFNEYIARLTTKFQADFPKSHFQNLEPGQFDNWAIESLRNAQRSAYPKTLKRGQVPNSQYKASTFKVAEESIAEAGYRLADLLESIFGH